LGRNGGLEYDRVAIPLACSPEIFLSWLTQFFMSKRSMIRANTVKQICGRWTSHMLFQHIDVAKLNAYKLFMLRHPELTEFKMTTGGRKKWERALVLELGRECMEWRMKNKKHDLNREVRQLCALRIEYSGQSNSYIYI
jgi:hypothetical protein